MAYKFQKGLFAADGAISGSSTGRYVGSISSSADLAVTGAIHAAQFYGGGAGITGISSDSVDVSNSTADSEFRLVGVAAAGSGVDLTCMDAAGTRVTMNASTGLLTITGDAAIGDDLSLTSDSAVLNMGAGNDVTFTHDGTTGLTIAASPISIDSTGELHLNSTTGDIKLQDGGTDQITFDLDGTAGDVIMKPAVDSDDLVLAQYDGTEVVRVNDDASLSLVGAKLGISNSSSDVVFKPLTDAKSLIFQQYDGTVALTINDDIEVVLGHGLVPDANDGAFLGEAGLAFSDLFLAEGAVINWDSGDVTLTQAGNLLTVAGGTFAAGAVTTSTIVASGIVKTDDTTDATSKTDGSLQTDGGLSVAKAIYNGTAATLAADSGVVTMGSTTGATVSAAGILNVNNTTEATSTTDGSLQTDGGLSVAKSAVIGDDLDLLSDSCVINIGSTSKFTLTDQAANNCVMAATNARLAFGNAGEYISGDGTDLKIVSSGDIDMTGDLDVVGTMSCDTSITLDTTTITTAEIGVLDGVTAGTAAASKALVLDASTNIATIGTVGCGAITSTGASSFGSITTTGNDTLGSAGDDSLTVNSIAAFKNGWELNITASGGAMDLTDAGALIVLCSGSGDQTVTLPGGSVPQDGYSIVIKNANSATRDVTITGSATGNVYDAFTIDGQTSLVLDSPYSAVNLIWDGDIGWCVY